MLLAENLRFYDHFESFPSSLFHYIKFEMSFRMIEVADYRYHDHRFVVIFWEAAPNSTKSSEIIIVEYANRTDLLFFSFHIYYEINNS